MTIVLVYLVIAIVLERVQLLIGRNSYHSIYNGFGAIDSVAERKADAPMSYRVLVPIIVYWTKKLIPTRPLSYIYEPIKVLSIFALLVVSHYVIGVTATLIFSVLVVSTFYFDYWDWVFECIGIVCALSGDPMIFMIGALLWALSKETAMLSPFIFLAVTQNLTVFLGGLILVIVVMFAVRQWVGKRKLYCERFMFRKNISDLQLFFNSHPFYLSEIAMAVMITILSIAAFAFNPQWYGLYVFAFLGAGWTMARAAESRVFAGNLIFIAMTLSKFM